MSLGKLVTSRMSLMVGFIELHVAEMTLDLRHCRELIRLKYAANEQTYFVLLGRVGPWTKAFWVHTVLATQREEYRLKPKIEFFLFSKF